MCGSKSDTGVKFVPSWGWLAFQGAAALHKSGEKEGSRGFFFLWTTEVHHWSVSCYRVSKDTTAHTFVPLNVKVRFRLHSAILCLVPCLCHV